MKTYYVNSLAQDKSGEIIMEEVITTIDITKIIKKDMILSKTEYFPERIVLDVEKGTTKK